LTHDRPGPPPELVSGAGDEFRRRRRSVAGRREEHPVPEMSTCLWFDTEALEAAELYVSVFPRSEVLEVVRWGENNPERTGQPLSVTFRLDGRDFVALNGGPGRPFTEAVSIMVGCADQAEVDHYWSRLLEGGGRESMCGWLADRYGLSWQIVPTRLLELMNDPDPARAGRVAAAMMQMVKIDLAEIERAAA